mmetsp:Transcript_12764/g.11319  ORF Transcript_12764/g.11319 Transcript_12764/m.11319 type:complete len:161 (+) Transcript_12764:144-626(+)
MPQSSIDCDVNGKISGFNKPSKVMEKDLKGVLFHKEQFKNVASSPTQSQKSFNSLSLRSVDICGKTLSKSESIIFKCTFKDCTKIFHKRWNHSLHMKMHLNIRQFECQFCSKKFIQKCNYNKHMKTHTIPNLEDRRIFKCNMCTKKYTQAYNLRNHMKVH